MEKLLGLRRLATETITQGESWLLTAKTKATPAGRIAHLYTLSIFEQFHATLGLFDIKAGTHAPSQIRCMLEYLVDLINVLNEPAYVDLLKAENALADHKVISKYEAALAGVELEEPMAGELAALRAEIEARERGYGQKRFEKIQQTHQQELPWMYSFLCGLTHPNLTSLMARHVLEDNSFAYCRPPEPSVQRMLLSMAIRLLSLTISQLPKFTDCEALRVADFVGHVDANNFQLQQYEGCR